MGALDDFANAGLPVPAIYASESAAADKAYQDALAAIAAQQQQQAQQFGFAVQTDPNTGALINTSIDPNQQFSSVMNLLGTNARSLRNLREQLSGAGLTGGGLRGLAAQRQALMRFQQQGQVAGLGAQFASKYGDLENQKAGARGTRDSAYNQAANDALNFAIANGWFNVADPRSPNYQPPPPVIQQQSTGGGDPGGYVPPDTGGNPGDFTPVADSTAINPISNTPMPDIGQMAQNYINAGGAASVTGQNDPFAYAMGTYKPVSGYSQQSKSNLH